MIKDEISALNARYKDERRTEIIGAELGSDNAEDFIKKEDVLITATKKGFIKRLPVNEYKTQRRGGKGVKGLSLRGEDVTDFIFSASSHDYVLFITSFGRAYWCRAYEIEEGSKATGKGSSIKGVLQLGDDETITAVLPFKEWQEGLSVLMVTKYGIAKRLELNLLKNARGRGVITIALDEGDTLDRAIFVEKDDDAMIVTKQGKGLRFSVNSIREMGRSAHGVKGIRIDKTNDEVVGCVRVDENRTALVIASNGKGKQVDYSLFKSHGRGTGGQLIYKCTEDVHIVDVLSVNDSEDDIICITALGQTIRMHASDISLSGRVAQGVNVFKMRKSDDYIVASSVVAREEYEDDVQD